MKKMNFLSIIAFLMLLAFSSSGWAAEAPYIAPIADQTATLGELFTYDVNAVNADPAENYQLLSGRPGMTIDQSTGVISWTPGETGDGGAVSVRAYNSAGESVRDFLVYISTAVECDDDLISYWKLDETTGDVYEDYKGGYSATSLTPLTNATGKVDNAKTFTPLGQTDQFVYVPDTDQYDFASSGGFSISVWFKYDGQYITGVDKNQVLIAKGSASVEDESLILLMVQTEDVSTPVVSFSLKVALADDPIKTVSSGPISPGQWYNAIAVYQGASSGQLAYPKIYLNTVPSSPAPHIFHNANFNTKYELNIGYWGRYEENRYPFNGSMDEILFYNKALSQLEVNAIFADGDAGKPHCKPGNYYPLFSSVPVTAAAQDVEYSYIVEAADYDNDLLTLSAVTIPSWLTFNAASGLLSGTPGSGDVGVFPVSIKATDGSIDIYQNFDIDVTNTNDPPEITSTPLTTIDEGATYTYFIVAEDLDEDPLVYTTPILPSWLTFNPDTKVLIGIPGREDAGDNPVKIVVSDGVFEATQEFTIEVMSDNNAPLITANPVISVDNYQEYAYTITAFDADPADVLSFTPELIPSWATFDVETHLLSGIPEKKDVGDHPVSLVVSDGWVDVKQEFVINVRDVNTAPVINSEANDTAIVDELYAYLLDVTDYDGDIITATGVLIPEWMTFNAGSRVLSGTPSSDDLGPHNVMITVSDGTYTVNELFTINVITAVGIDISSKLVNSVYPNPANEFVVFEFIEQASSIEITDLSGKVLIRESVDSGDMQVQINVSELNNGMYMFRVFDETKSQHQTGKIVIN